MITGIVLAAGESARMGQPKQLLPLGAETLLGVVLALVTDALDDVLVVLGASADAIRERVNLHGAHVALNEDYASGQASSLLAGLRVLGSRPTATAAMVLLGDQPGVRREVIEALCETHRQRPEVATIVPRYGTQVGNPVLFARAAWPALAAGLSGDEGARRLIAHGQPAPLLSLPFPAGWLPAGVDTWEDYQMLVARWPS